MYEDFKADIKLEGRDIDSNMSEEEIESDIEEPLDPALENIARYLLWNTQWGKCDFIRLHMFDFDSI